MLHGVPVRDTFPKTLVRGTAPNTPSKVRGKERNAIADNDNTCTITFRCSPAVKDKIIQDAQNSGLSKSEYLRKLACGQVVPQAPPPLPKEFWEVPRSIQDISDQLNQILWEMRRSGKVDRKLKKVLLEESGKFEEVRREILKKYVTK